MKTSVGNRLSAREDAILAAVLEEQRVDDIEVPVEAVYETYAADLAVSRGEAISLLRRLDELGAGTFKVGRRNRPTRLEWAPGARPTLVEACAAQRGDGREIVHRYQLRPDHVVEVRLPADLSSHEADRLAAFIRTLPFEGHGNGAGDGGRT